jgi:hypothetical protein
MVAYIGLWLGRGFSGRELHTPIRALGPDENPPGDQVTPRAEITGLSHRPRQSAQMLLPRMASPVLRHLQDTTRHAPTQLHSSNTGSPVKSTGQAGDSLPLRYASGTMAQTVDPPRRWNCPFVH